PVDAEQPRGADDEVALVGSGGGLLAGELGAAVGAQGRGLVHLDVGRVLLAVEDVVTRYVDDLGAGLRRRGGDIARAGAVDLHRRLLGLLRPVHIGPGRAVDDRRRALAGGALRDSVGVGDVEVGVGERHDLVPRV